MPFLRNVVRGRGVPDERLAEVAEHYHHFGGVSPINAQCRELLAALRPSWPRPASTCRSTGATATGTRTCADTLAQMRDDGVRRALAFVTSPFGSYSSCRQYLDDIEAARAAVGPGAPEIDKIRHYHDHPGLRPAARGRGPARRCANSPMWSRYDLCLHRPLDTVHNGGTERAGRWPVLARSCARPRRWSPRRRRAAAGSAEQDAWDLVWQSRSGPPQRAMARAGHQRPPGRAGRGRRAGRGGEPDRLHLRPPRGGLGPRHARRRRRPGDWVCASRGPRTPGTDPRFVAMVRDLVLERLDPAAPGPARARCRCGTRCPTDCCRPRRPVRRQR